MSRRVEDARILMYSHDTFGLGHLRRCRTIAHALVEDYRGLEIMIISGATIAGARKVYKATEQNAPLRANATLEAVGGTAVYLASDLGACTTGEVIFVDGGFHVLGMAQPEYLE